VSVSQSVSSRATLLIVWPRWFGRLPFASHKLASPGRQTHSIICDFQLTKTRTMVFFNLFELVRSLSFLPHGRRPPSQPPPLPQPPPLIGIAFNEEEVSKARPCEPQQHCPDFIASRIHPTPPPRRQNNILQQRLTPADHNNNNLRPP
jgi:hypothetical protein